VAFTGCPLFRFFCVLAIVPKRTTKVAAPCYYVDISVLAEENMDGKIDSATHWWSTALRDYAAMYNSLPESDTTDP
jgi:hypothetical protein